MLQHKVSLAATAALLVLFPVALAGCQSKAQPGAEQVSAEPKSERAEELAGHRVEVVVVQPSKRSLTLTVPGEVEAHRDAMLAAPMGGYIERVMVEEGDRVKHGQILASVDRAVHAVRLERAEVDLSSAERELARAKSLGTSIPRAEIDSAEDRVAMARANLREIKLNVSRSIVSAPFSGYVTKVDAEVGEVAAPGEPLMRLVQLQPVNVSVALSDRDVALAQVGGPAIVQLDARGTQVEGKVVSISRAANLKTRSFEALIEIANEDEKLLPGMIASVTLKTEDLAADERKTADANKKGSQPKTSKAASKPGEAAAKEDGEPEASKDELVISQDWLVTRPEGVGVFVEQEGKAVWRPVKLGEVVRKQVEVKRGLQAGDALIIVGHRELVDGDQVLVQRKGRCCVQGRASFD